MNLAGTSCKVEDLCGVVDARRSDLSSELRLALAYRFVPVVPATLQFDSSKLFRQFG